MKNELTEYKQLYDTDSSRGPRIPYYMYVRLTVALWCPYDGGFTSCVRKAIKKIDFKMQVTLSKGKQNMIYKMNRQSGKTNFKIIEVYSLFITPKCV